MKKSIIFLMLTIFLVVSCSSSKKAENDADILPDEDAVDVDEDDEDEDDDSDDEVNVDEDKTDDEEPDEDEDYDEDNPCNPNPCEDLERTTGECIASYDSEYDYSCVCEDRYKYYWDYFEAKCTNACEGNPCANKEHSDGHCSLFDTPSAYECDCEEGYHWAYFDCVKDGNPCEPNPCEETEHSDGVCTIFYGDYYCGCIEGYSWDSESQKCIADEIPDENSDADTHETPDSNNSESGE